MSATASDTHHSKTSTDAKTAAAVSITTTHTASASMIASRIDAYISMIKEHTLFRNIDRDQAENLLATKQEYDYIIRPLNKNITKKVDNSLKNFKYVVSIKIEDLENPYVHCIIKISEDGRGLRYRMRK